MNEIQKNAFAKALKTLTALNCKFAVITPDNEKFGTLDVVEKSKRFSKYKKGEVTKYITQFLNNMKVGDVFEIPADKFDLKDIQPRVCDWFSKNRGKDSVTTHQNKTKNVLEVFYIG